MKTTLMLCTLLALTLALPGDALAHKCPDGATGDIFIPLPLAAELEALVVVEDVAHEGYIHLCIK